MNKIEVLSAMKQLLAEQNLGASDLSSLTDALATAPDTAAEVTVGSMRFVGTPAEGVREWGVLDAVSNESLGDSLTDAELREGVDGYLTERGTEVDKEVIRIQPIYDEEDPSKQIGAMLTYAGGATEYISDLSDPRLKQQILANFFVRSFKEPGLDDSFATFEVSPVGQADMAESITVQVPIYKSSGDIDPRYEMIKDAITRQKHKFIKLKLLRDVGTDHCRLLNFSLPDNSPVSVSLVDAKALKHSHPEAKDTVPLNATSVYVETDSAHEKEFTFTESLENACDTHGQWRVAESHLLSLRQLTDHPMGFGRLQSQAETGAKEHMRLFLQTAFDSKAKPPAEQEEINAKIEAVVREYEINMPDLRPNNLEGMLSGGELHCDIAGNLEPKKIIYDLDKPFKDQLTGLDDLSFLSASGTDGDKMKVSLYSQMTNYAYQRALKSHIVENCRINATFQRSEAELLDVMPITNPKRTKEEKSLLNSEYAQMIGNHVIAAQMQHFGCTPNQAMRSLEEGGAADVFLKSLDYDNIDKSLPYDEFNKKLMEHTRGVLIRNKHDITEIVEHECYAPGKSPKAKREAALGEVDDNVKTMAIVGGAVGATADGFVGDMENISVFK